MQPELYKFYSIKEFLYNWPYLIGFENFKQIPLPTEVIVRNASFVIPNMARVWRTNIDNIYCMEVFDDKGDDGHISYQHVGYAFVNNHHSDEELFHLMDELIYNYNMNNYYH